jgi:hypothetical protein
MSLIHRLAGRTFSDATLPLLYPDKMANPGTKFIFDLLNGYCTQGLVLPVGVNPFATGDAFQERDFPRRTGRCDRRRHDPILRWRAAPPRRWEHRRSRRDLRSFSDQSELPRDRMDEATDNAVVSAAQAICGLAKTNANDCQFGFSFSNASSQFNAIAGGTTQPSRPHRSTERSTSWLSRGRREC